MQCVAVGAGVKADRPPILPSRSAPVVFTEEPADEVPPPNAPVMDLDRLPGMLPKRKKAPTRQPGAGDVLYV
jgi:hypothetical protein